MQNPITLRPSDAQFIANILREKAEDYRNFDQDETNNDDDIASQCDALADYLFARVRDLQS